MNVKRYMGASVQEIMSKVRMELGPDAVILSQRSVRKQGLMGWFQPPMIEVMVAFEEGREPLRPAPKPKPKYPPIPAQTPRAGDKPVIPPPQTSGVPTAQARAAASAIAEVLSGQRGKQGAIVPPVFLAPDEMPARTPAQDDLSRPSPAARASAPDQDLVRKVDRLSEMLSNVSLNLTSLSSSGSVASSLSSDIGPLYLRLIEQEVSPDLALTLAREGERLAREEGMAAFEAMKTAVANCLGEGAPLKPGKARQQVVLMAGPTGVGKTTTLIKLAALQSVKENRRIGIINADTYRIGAKEQIATYAEILEAPLSVVYETDGLTGAMRAQRDRDVLFIDTAGKKPSDEKHKEDVRKIIKTCKPDRIFVIVSSATGNRACMEIVRNCEYLKDYSLIFTKVDEAPSLGVILNVAHSSGMPVAYLTFGQKVPDDIGAADTGKIASAILGEGEAW